MAALIIALAFLSSVLSGMFGMAGGIVLMGALSWMLPVATALALHGTIQLVSNLWRAVLYYRHVKWGVLGWFAVGAVSATALFALIAFNPDKFLVFLMLGLLPVLVWVPERWLSLDAAQPRHAVIAGFAATALSLVSGVAGPVTDLFFVRTALTRHEVVATKAVMQPFGHGSKVLLYGAALMSAQTRAVISPVVIIAALGASMAGIMVGGAILNRMRDETFAWWRRWIVTALGATFLVEAARMALA